MHRSLIHIRLQRPGPLLRLHPRARTLAMAAAEPPAVCVLNAGRFDWDRAMDYGGLTPVASVTVNEGDDPTIEDVKKWMSACASSPTVVVTKEIAVSAEVIAALPETVRLLCEAGTGFNNIDMEAAQARGITVCNVPAYSQDAVAQLVITFVLNFSCSMMAQQRALFQGDRSNGFTAPFLLPHYELGGKTMGLIGGRGNIGSKVTALARAFGMKVLCSSRTARDDEDGIHYTTEVDEVLANSDFVSIHCPLNAETRHLIDGAKLALMKKGAVIINTARGGVIDQNALIAALQDGTIGGAGLDVQDPEPPAPDSPLWELPNVLLTPHIGWRRKETRQRCVDGVAANVVAFLSGEAQNVVS